MLRLLMFTLAVGTLLLSVDSPAADGPMGATVSGRWKFRMVQGEDTITFLFAFTESDGKWVGDYIGSSAKLKSEPMVSKLDVAGDKVKFVVSFGARELLNFDGVLAKDGKKISGSYSQFGGPLQLTDLYPSKLKKLDDAVDVARETLTQVDGTAIFDAGFTVLGQATAKKIPAEEVRGIADKITKTAAAYGPRWESTITLKLAATLADQEGFADVALAQVRRAERMMGDDAPAAMQMQVFETINRVLTKAGKADEAKKYAVLVQKLEAKDFADYTKSTLSFNPEAYPGRKAKSDRVVLVEVFTGAECPPCTAVDLACDGLLQAFKPSDVIVLNYHFHVPAPDPLTSPASLERANFYGEQITGAPTIFLNGKVGPGGGGPAAAAKEKYTAFRGLIEKQLETPATAKLALTVTPNDKGYVAKATVTDLEAPGEKVALRFVLVEDRIRYAGGNGIRYHHHVVRDVPGGIKGAPLTKKTHEQAVTIDVAELKAKLGKYLEDYAKTEGEFPRADRPLAMTGLKLIAFVQNDATGEILQSAQVDLDAKK